MTTKFVVYIGITLFLCSCQKEQKGNSRFGEVTPQKVDTLAREKKTLENKHQTLSTLTFENVFLISGGSPSVSVELSIANLYSSRVQKFMDSSYKVLNTAIAQEPDTQLAKRLPRLFEHEVSVFVLEIGADEEKAGFSKKRFTDKLNIILQAIEAQAAPPQIIIVPSSSKKNYLDCIHQINRPSLTISILQAAEFSPYTAEWHEYMARQLSKVVK